MRAGPQTHGARGDAAKDDPQIVAIIPAIPGWWAVWRDDTGEVLDPVPAWALVEHGRYRWPAALVPYGENSPDLQLANSDSGYCGLRYFAPGAEPLPAWAPDPIA